MWKLILGVSLSHGILIYLASLVIAKINLNYKNLKNVLKEVSPHAILDNYMPDKGFNSIIIMLFMRLLLYVIGYVGILTFSVIHTIYYYLSKKGIPPLACPDDLSNFITTTKGYKPTNYDEDKSFKTIDLIIESSILEKINMCTLYDKLIEYNIKWYRYSNLSFSSTTTSIFKIPLGEYGAGRINILSDTIDNAIFMLNDKFPNKCIDQTICICWDDEYYKDSSFKHLCVPIPVEDEPIINEDYYAYELADEIYKCLNGIN